MEVGIPPFGRAAVREAKLDSSGGDGLQESDSPSADFEEPIPRHAMDLPGHGAQRQPRDLGELFATHRELDPGAELGGGDQLSEHGLDALLGRHGAESEHRLSE